MTYLTYFFFFLAVLATGLLGNETRLLLLWPGAITLAVVGLLTLLRGRIRVTSVPHGWCLLLACVTFIYFVTRAFLSPVLEYAKEDLVLFAVAMIGYASAATTVSHPRWRLFFVVMLLVLALGNLAVGAVHLSGNWSFHILSSYFERAFGEGRIGGFYNNPNHLAAFLLFPLFLSLGWVCFGRGGANGKLLLAFLIVCCMLGMTLTTSRAALLSLGVGFLSFALLSGLILLKTHPQLLLRLGSAVLLLGLVLGAVLWKVNESFLRRRMSSLAANEDIRFPVWQSAMLQNQENPALGAGSRMFYDRCVTYRQPGMPSWIGEAEFVHNEWIQALSDYGWVGLVLLALTLLWHLWSGGGYLRWFARDQAENQTALLSHRLGLAIGAMSALVASAVHAGFEFHWHVGSIALAASFCLGILANPGFPKGARIPTVIPGNKLLLKACLAAAMSLIAVFAWTTGRAEWMANRGERALNAGEMQVAIGFFQKATELDPQSWRHHKALGEALIDDLANVDQQDKLREHLDEARRALETAATLNPHAFLIATALADVYQGLGESDLALQEIQRALTLAPAYEEPRLALALYHHRRTEFQEAERAYLWASKSRAGNTGTFNWSSGYFNLLEMLASWPPPQ